MTDEEALHALAVTTWKTLKAQQWRDVAGTIQRAFGFVRQGTPAAQLDAALVVLHEPITEEWLKSVGFKWHQIERQNEKHWVLWLGRCLGCDLSNKRLLVGSDSEQLGIELAWAEFPRGWSCWFRSDTAGRYHRFIHVRYLRAQFEVIQLTEALSGREWSPENHIYGSVLCQRCADRERKEAERLDRLSMQDRAKWYEAEKDDTRDRALPEHLDEAIKKGGAK